jgi:AcrR family transcriptional regulator
VVTEAAQQHRRSSETVRGAILDAATDEFTTSGYAQATMRTVAARAQVSLSVLYRHFSGKEELFAAAVTRPFTAFLEQFASAWSRFEEPAGEAQLIEEFVRDLQASLTPQRRALLQLVAVSDGPNAALAADLRSSLATVVTEIGHIARVEARRRGRDPGLSLQRVWLVISLVIGELLMRPWKPEILGGSGVDPGVDSGVDPGGERSTQDAILRLLAHGLLLGPSDGSGWAQGEVEVEG